jgi:ABC-type sugar transport system ATPase subunit
MASLRLENVRKRFGKLTALERIPLSLESAAGESLAALGLVEPGQGVR